MCLIFPFVSFRLISAFKTKSSPCSPSWVQTMNRSKCIHVLPPLESGNFNQETTFFELTNSISSALQMVVVFYAVVSHVPNTFSDTWGERGSDGTRASMRNMGKWVVCFQGVYNSYLLSYQICFKYDPIWDVIIWIYCKSLIFTKSNA